MQKVKVIKNEAKQIVLLIDNKPIGPVNDPMIFHLNADGNISLTVTFPIVTVDLKTIQKS